jgi:hypothetical protein
MGMAFELNRRMLNLILFREHCFKHLENRGTLAWW